MRVGRPILSSHGGRRSLVSLMLPTRRALTCVLVARMLVRPVVVSRLRGILTIITTTHKWVAASLLTLAILAVFIAAAECVAVVPSAAP